MNENREDILIAEIAADVERILRKHLKLAKERRVQEAPVKPLPLGSKFDWSKKESAK